MPAGDKYFNLFGPFVTYVEYTAAKKAQAYN